MAIRDFFRLEHVHVVRIFFHPFCWFFRFLWGLFWIFLSFFHFIAFEAQTPKTQSSHSFDVILLMRLLFFWFILLPGHFWVSVLKFRLTSVRLGFLIVFMIRSNCFMILSRVIAGLWVLIGWIHGVDWCRLLFLWWRLELEHLTRFHFWLSMGDLIFRGILLIKLKRRGRLGMKVGSLGIFGCHLMCEEDKVVKCICSRVNKYKPNVWS